MGPYLLILVPGVAWVTGNALLGAVVARTVFAHAPAPMAACEPGQLSRALAGELFGDALQVWYGLPVSLCCLAICVGLGWLAGRLRTAGRPATSVALILTFVVLGLLHMQTVGTVTAVGQQAAAMRQLAPDEADLRRPAFQTAHHTSELLVKLETAVVAAIVAGAAGAALRVARPTRPAST